MSYELMIFVKYSINLLIGIIVAYTDSEKAYKIVVIFLLLNIVSHFRFLG